MRFECLWMDGFYGKVAEDILDLAGFDVVLIDLGQRRTDVPGAEGSLVVREVDYRYLCASIAFKGFIADVQNHRLKRFCGLSSSWSRSLSLSKEVFNRI